MTLQFKTRHCNDICCVDLTSVYGNKMRKFILLCLQVFVISVLLFKSLSSLQFRISRFKRQRLLFGRHILIIFHIIFGVPLRFFRIIFTFNDVVEQLLMIPGTFFKFGQGNIFICIQRCHSQCWLDKLSFLLRNYLLGAWEKRGEGV